ncbi:integral membrane protein, TIGR00529 family [Caminicella sporogenes DSM 14501]|uniref:Integral membrane protein, TIGR00529 family n=1 Tax=Caminicella sporogenes DSM 14501 TaxID=1121266 RepID=A0A1M6NVL0_9FIRM|nr:DUF401 family protein [Caminicella sporogenes]RKD21632.1 hypothetical protein BET04_07925 [Caminicella sporogenes]SHJ99715.1 integral membrane protein, TIGR00529 family [Caminicella sporogenes DSM 14501]
MLLFTLILSLTLVIYLANKKVNIGLSLVLGAFLIGILNGLKILSIINVFLKAVLDPITIELAVSIILICILGQLMEEFKILDRMVFSLEKVLMSAKATILVVPAIMGTMLVTGGALLSAPIVDSLGKRLNLSPEKKASINLIFRHALYFIYPFSPTIILAAKVGNLNLWDFIKLQFPLSILMYIIGYFIYLHGVEEPVRDNITFTEYLKNIKDLLIYLSPIYIGIVASLAYNIPFYLSLIMGIIVCILINYLSCKGILRGIEKTVLSNENKKSNLLKIMIKGIKPSMVYAVLGIMCFKGIIQEINEINILLNQYINKGVPLEVIIVLFGVVASFATASTQTAIALLYPIILPLAETEHIKLLYAMMIYTTGFMAYFISPLHLCQVLTLEYYKVGTKELYRNYKFLLPAVYLTMLIIYYVYK